ncbi:MAG: transposase [Snodgrassella sp.]|nr:transposase [Snodgrassella sp.]
MIFHTFKCKKEDRHYLYKQKLEGETIKTTAEHPFKIRVDNGPEFTGNTFTNWAKSHGITIAYIKPGSPYQNGFIERFNRSYRTEVLDLYLFNNLEQARKVTEEWLTIYNTERPHEALNNMTPIEYKTLQQAALFST